MCGSAEQKARWLPDMARMTKLGAFALTEPEHGSDSIALETSARPDGHGGWVLFNLISGATLITRGIEVRQTGRALNSVLPKAA
jgi:alkylation response protein AidB-like acyl-CoA dehydrogenase